MTDEELKRLFNNKLYEEKKGKTKEPRLIQMGELIEGSDGVYRCPSVINRGS